MPSPWVAYRVDVEVEQPDEAALIDEIVASMGRANRMIFDQHRHALRGRSRQESWGA